MRRQRPDATNSDGFDSFLDIVANLVGILVILIMVLGVRAKNAILHHTPEPSDTAATIVSPPEAVAIAEPAAPRALPDTDTPARDAEALRENAWRLEAERKKLQEEGQVQRAYRDQIQLLVSLAEKELEQQRNTLSSIQQAALDRQTEKDRLSDELAVLRQTLATEVVKQPTPQVIEHHPTPLAKTVFGIEWHFRLLDGRLAYVPVDEFVREVKNEVRHKLWKLENMPEVTEVIGPIEGFQMRYVLQRKTQVIQTPQGAVRRSGPELAYFELQPVNREMGEPIEQALLPDSEFRRRLKSAPPQDTTITVWTYPDSFGAYHDLKETLWKMGYSVAARPIPFEVNISGSPHGTNSVTQ